MDYFSSLLNARKSKKSPVKKTSPTSPEYRPLNMKFEGTALHSQLRSIKKKRKSPKAKSPEIDVTAIKKARANYKQAIKRENAAKKIVKASKLYLKKIASLKLKKSN